jgi:radical SAM-linked protein
MSLLEGVFARGDRRLGPVLLNAWRRGCRFDGWSDQFEFAAWMAAFADCGVDPGFYTARERHADEELPWDHIDTRVTREFLRAEWEKAVAGHPTADCRDGLCHGCGVCDFEGIQPRVHREIPAVDAPPPSPAPEPAKRPVFYHKLQVSYSKTGSARFFGHLELVNIFLRALRRAGVAVKFSEGFHPKPKVSFDNPLPSGFESEEERLVVTVPLDVTPGGLVAGLNAHLPEGLKVTACGADIRSAPPLCAYRIRFAEAPARPERFARSSIDFDQGLTLSAPKRKLKNIEVKDILFDVGMPDPRTLVMTLACEPGKTVRPGEVLRQVFGLSEETVQTALIRKLKTIPG